MSLTLEIGPLLYLLGKYTLLGVLLAYLIREWWMIAASKGRR